MWDAELIYSRLAEFTRLDPECTRMRARRHRYQLGPRLTTREVVAFERRIGAELPVSFRAFLTEVGHGGAGPSLGLWDLEQALRHDVKSERFRSDEEIRSFYSTPFPHTQTWNPPIEEETEEYLESRWITGSMVVSEYGCGSYHRLVITGEAAGQVWFDDRANDHGMDPQADFFEWYMSWLDKVYKRLMGLPWSGAGNRDE